jgi:release factor glutamine methyltransferase
MLTLKAALEEATATIGRVDAQVLVAHLLGVERSYLIANPMRVLTETEDARIDMLVAQRAIGHPVAHLVAQREFYGRMFAISADVLIPRPETETLVEEALKRLPPLLNRPNKLGTPAAVLDLGTGSGAVAITLACERPDLAVTATDASERALDMARLNAHALGAEVEFVAGSWFKPLTGRRFGMIISNPPYVAARDPHLAEGDLRFEPRQALTDGSADGLASIRAIVSGAPAHLEPGGWLLVEHGYDQRDAVAGLLEEAGFDDTFSIADLAGIPRVGGGRLDPN